MTNTTGFYATDTDVFYVTPSGRIFLVASDDSGSSVEEMDEMPQGATPADSLLTPQECISHCRRVEVASGEKLIEEA
jgi:hypothetical protein